MMFCSPAQGDSWYSLLAVEHGKIFDQRLIETSSMRRQILLINLRLLLSHLRLYFCPYFYPSGSKILRVLDSLQLTATRSLATPADWVAGGECMILPSVKPEQAAETFPEVRPQF